MQDAGRRFKSTANGDGGEREARCRWGRRVSVVYEREQE